MEDMQLQHSNWLGSGPSRRANTKKTSLISEDFGQFPH